MGLFDKKTKSGKEYKVRVTKRRGGIFGGSDYSYRIGDTNVCGCGQKSIGEALKDAADAMEIAEFASKD